METASLSGKVFEETFDIAFHRPDIHIIVNEGGARSGKTYAILQVLALMAKASPDPLIISVVTQTFPQLRGGALRDFSHILPALPIPFHENKTTHTWEIGKSQIEFFSADDPMKVLGPQRDILFINECHRLGWETVRQLMIRTSGKIFFDYNPVSRFWINEHILNRPDVIKIHSTYKDNEHLSPMQIAEIESHKHDENWWRVYGLGLEGRLEGLVYPDWDIVDQMPEGCRVRYGVDFGYNDPTAVVKVGILGEDLYLEELVYSPGLISSDISQKLDAWGVQRRSDRIIGDAAAAEQIETLYRMGWNIHPCKKGKGSIDNGIKTMKEYRIHVTADSPNIQRELLNYTWEKDKDDKLLNAPIDAYNHSLDACRYAVTDLATKAGGYNLSFV